LRDDSRDLADELILMNTSGAGRARTDDDGIMSSNRLDCLEVGASVSMKTLA